MATSNRDRVARVMDLLREGLGPFVLREYKMVYHKDYGREIYKTLSTDRHGPPEEAFESEETLLAYVDVHGWLNLMWRHWNEVFHEKLGHAERSYVSELLEARNSWAHQQSFNNEEAYRVADTATLLLRAISAADYADGTHEIAQDLLRLRFEAEAKKARRTTSTVDEVPTTKAGLRPWRQVVEPHPDVASGRYLQAEFAADLAQVTDGKADIEYQDPLEFFRRTYLTEGLLDLLVTGVLRLSGEGGDPVVQLQTSFGGGKTHSMLALYHLSGSGIRKFADIPGGERIEERIPNIDPPEPNRAVLVGTALDPTTPRQHEDGVTTHTLWGELAYQLGGLEGHKMVETADLRGVSPGSNTLLDLMETFGPCLIIVDELVAYARNLYRVEGLPGGSFDAVMTFIQALTEATRRSSDSMLLVSIPASDIEIGGEGGREALEILANVIGRIESVWKPVTATESFEIVRRRLFASEIDYPARDAVVAAFAEMYRQNTSEFPSGVAEGEYRDRMRAAYPIHPELFDRLYQDWSTLERFQRTRGVLRLMAAVIHDLWTRNDQSLMIMPSTIPLDSAPVRNEMLRYLLENWPAVVDTDIDGPESRPFAIDQSVPMLGRYAACRRVARSIFVGSAPSVAAQTVRGVEEVRVRIATAQPGESIAVFGDALKRMGNQLTYLYTDGSRYWYDTHPTVNRLARDRAQQFSVDEVNREIITRLKRVGKTRDFAAAHVAPLDTSDVIDDAQARVVVLHPDDTHKRSNGDSPALRMCRDLLEARGNSPRLYRNMLVFIAPDQGGAEALREAMREYLAWQSIRNDEEQLNLDRQQSRQVRTQLDRADETVDVRLMDTYNWLIVPWQSEPLGGIEWETFRISGSESFYDRAARKLLKDGLLIPAWSPDNLRMEMERFNLWGDSPHVPLKQLWEYFGRYCYLSRLLDENVLLGAIKDGISRLDAPFAYATGIEDERYLGLAFRSASSIYFDNQSLLVQPEAAQKQIDEEQRHKPVPVPTPGGFDGGLRPSDDDDLEPDDGDSPIATRYYGTVELDAQRINREIGVIVEEVIQRLTSMTGCDVEVHLEVRASRPEGFDEAAIRTISENSRTLKFDTHEFD
jgi:predicted AAA+ superfamily ATPase